MIGVTRNLDEALNPDVLLNKWHKAFRNFFGFVEEAADLASLVSQSLNNSRTLDDAVAKSVEATFPAVAVHRSGDGIRRIVKHSYEIGKSISDLDHDAQQAALESLDLEVEDMALEIFPLLRSRSRTQFLKYGVQNALEGVERRMGGPRLYGGLLLQLDSAFEVFMGELITTVCLKYPQDYDLKVLGVTSREIVRAEESEGVSALFAEREAASVLNRSLDSWIAWFVQPSRKILPSPELNSLKSVMRYHLIRNVLAHGDGKPQNRHAAQIQQLGMTEDDFQLDRRAFDDACRSYVALAYEVWATAGDKLFREEAFYGPLTQVQTSIIKSRFVGSVSGFSHSNLHAWQEGEVKVNFWLAELRCADERDCQSIRDKKEIRSDVGVWEPSATDARRDKLLKLAKIILMGEQKNAEARVRSLLDDKTLSLSMIYDWPLLMDLNLESVLEKSEE